MGSWIVIVDDEETSLSNAKVLLGGQDMRVSCLRSGKDLLKFVKKHAPDLILLDILMPEMDGFETYRALREYEDKAGVPNIPVIFLTGEDDKETEKHGLELGASDFIRKPFDKDIVIKRINNTVTNNRTIENLTEEAMIDKLTGFLNKSRGTDRLSKLCARKTGALMMIDIDSFKLVNDLYGHDMGDSMLQAFSDVVRRNIRETDTVSRVGGDEFVAFFEDLTLEKDVAALTERLNAQTQEEAFSLLGEDHGIPIGISIGVVMVPEHGRKYEELFPLADNMLYAVKNNGKHGYCIYNLSMGNDDEGNSDEKKLEQLIKIVEERKDLQGALLLGIDSFALVYRFILRFYKRYGGTASLLLFTLNPYEKTDNIKLTEVCTKFEDILQKSLRMSDLIMQNGSNSFLVMLTERTRAEAEGAAERIVKEWSEAECSDMVGVGFVFKYIDYSEGSDL